MLAGEPSGDLHAAKVAEALRKRWPDARLLGTGGDRMARAGVELLAHVDDLAVMGFAEVVRRVPFFLSLERKLDRVLQEGAVDLVLPVDFPGFNLRMTRRAHDRGIPVVYYIAPQVWAWKKKRAARLARMAARIAVILPFEEEIFRREGGDVTFVGHPLLDEPSETEDRATFCRTYGLEEGRPILALFPGSRQQELDRHLDPFLEAAFRSRIRDPSLQLVVARGAGLRIELPEGRNVFLVSDGRGLLRHARAALVKSGTTTLEAALEGTPFVVAYRTHPLTYFLAKQVVQVDHVALANLVAGARVVPELLQDAVTPESLERAIRPLLGDTPIRKDVLAGLASVRERLGRPGAADRVAGLVAEALEEGGLR